MQTNEIKNNKVIFIGMEAIHSALQQMVPEYDFQKPLANLQEFTQEMEDPNSEISKESTVIILFSRLFDEDEDLFAKTVAFYAPYAAVNILIPDEDAEMLPRIEGYIKAEQRIMEADPSIGTDSNTPFYFISYSSPIGDLTEAMSKYVQDPLGNANAKRVIRDMLPSHYAETLSQFEEFDDTTAREFSDEFDLPEAAQDAQGTVIAVTSSKGGSGKSTVSMILGTYIAKSSIIAAEEGLMEEPLKVCIVDMDTRDGQLGFLNGATRPSVFNIIGKTVGTDITPEAIKEGIFSSPNLQCDFIFAPRRSRYASTIQPSFYASLIQELRGLYDYVILDTSVNYLDPLLEKVAYPLADKIVLVTDMGRSSVMGMARWIDETTTPIDAGGSGIDRNKVGIVVNKALPRVGMDAEHIEKAAMGVDIIAMLPSAPELITHKANMSALDETLLHPKINASFKHLAEAVVDPKYKLGDIPYIEIKK